ncbi:MULTISPECIES: universal stress protein [Enterococcaceae]|uniref:universal stress protein n=1 Tax=Enterococcaceae TaxID=81852 RepID=UPI000E4FEE38|nr:MULTISPECIES: universal stress protein [Enterococcaceae]MCI0130414.1 universal stress protein [Vagococcus sp. CY53-2]RGI32144.1 universal stress protein [Melissococcus sp. OM08-11BH]UNM89849.1 universal stress protein [Vagococcus sp. CY52-2]
MLESQEYRSILVGTDGSEQAQQAFEKAVAVAKRNNADIVVAHIIENKLYGGTMAFSTFSPDIVQEETNQAKELLESYLQIANDLGYDRVKATLEFGSPKVMMATELPEKYDTDLIMVGQSGLNAVERLVMGSVSDHIIRTAPCDVLVVRPE